MIPVNDHGNASVKQELRSHTIYISVTRPLTSAMVILAIKLTAAQFLRVAL